MEILVFLSLIASGLAARAMNPGIAKPVSLNASTNIWLDYTLHPNSIFRAKVEAAAKHIEDGELRQKALRVAEIGTFIWV